MVMRLTDRRAERRALDGVTESVRAGRSRVMVMRGDAGVGKSALLDYLARRASDSGCRVVRAVGVQSEMELAFAAVAYAHWAAAVLHNGSGQYTEALGPARQASDDTFALHISMWALPELVEAAARSGDTHLAAEAAGRLTEYT
ncbi:MAG TPA: ATP-binding protein, partial [Streptosporangiaceae bacterium]|nr:ATP-binding protein [Streptosporangiaceae bacterium]